MTYKEIRDFENKLYAEIEGALKEVGETGRELTEREQKYYDALVAVQSLRECLNENECPDTAATVGHSAKLSA